MSTHNVGDANDSTRDDEPSASGASPADQRPPAQPAYGAPAAFGAQPGPEAQSSHGQPPYGAQPAGQPAYGAAPMSAQDAKTWAILGHAGGIVLSFVAGLIVFLVHKDKNPWLRQQAVEALNFQLTMMIAMVALWVIGGILTAILIGFFILFLAFVPWVLQVVFGILAAMKASNGEEYRYPISIRMVK